MRRKGREKPMRLKVGIDALEVEYKLMVMLDYGLMTWREAKLPVRSVD